MSDGSVNNDVAGVAPNPLVNKPFNVTRGLKSRLSPAAKTGTLEKFKFVSKLLFPGPNGSAAVATKPSSGMGCQFAPPLIKN